MGIKVRIGAPVTTTGNLIPPHQPDTFIFDTRTLHLYLDLRDGTRVPVMSPVELDIYGDPTVHGSITVTNTSGTTTSDVVIQNGAVRADDGFVITNVAIKHASSTLNKYAVFDDNGNLLWRTKEEIKNDLDIHETVLETEKTSVTKAVSYAVDASTETLEFGFNNESVVKNVSVINNT